MAADRHAAASFRTRLEAKHGRTAREVGSLALAAGDRVGPDEILSLPEAGGMGEVGSVGVFP